MPYRINLDDDELRTLEARQAGEPELEADEPLPEPNLPADQRVALALEAIAAHLARLVPLVERIAR